jgi:hypothetical protein
MTERDYTLVPMSSAPKKRSWLSLVVTLLGVSTLCGLCIIPSLPGFFAEQQEHKQRECREGLRAVMNKFHELRDAGVGMTELKAAVPGARFQPYTYVFGEGVTVPPERKPPAEQELARQLGKVRALVQPGVRGTCPDCTLTVACVGNTDGDDELDLLSLSSQERYVFGDLPVRADETYRHLSDYASDPETPVRFEPTDGGN